MRYSVLNLSSFAVIEAFQRAYQIAGNTANSFKRNVVKFVFQIDKIAACLDSLFLYDSVAVFLFSAVCVGIDLLLGDLLSDHFNLHCGVLPSYKFS